MTRAQLEHLIRAAGTIVNSDDIVVIGSQAILGQFPYAPPQLLMSTKGDSDLIDGTIGEGLPFNIHLATTPNGVDETTAILPSGWRDRLILITGENTRFIRGWCLEIHDLAIAKLTAGREKDLEFIAVLARHHLVERATLRLVLTPLDENRRRLVGQRLLRHFVE